MATLVQDSFDRADNTDLGSPDIGPEDWNCHSTSYGQVYQHHFIAGATGPAYIDCGEQNFTVEAKVQATAEYSKRSGIAFAIQDYNHFTSWDLWYYAAIPEYRLLLNTWNGSSYSYPYFGAEPLETGTWYTLKVVVNGNHVKCYCDDELITEKDLTVADNYMGNTKVGLVSGAGFNRFLDDFLVTGGDEARSGLSGLSGLSGIFG